MSRDGSGTYTLPLADVVTGTAIEASWANSSLGDIETELTDSLSRSGKGNMSVPLKVVSGTVSAPGLTFISEANSGLYRSSAGDIRFALLGADHWRVTASGLQVYISASWKTPLTDANISDTAYGAGWNGDTTTAPSKNAVYDKIEALNAAFISDTAYGSGWNGVTDVAPSKNAVYDKIEAVIADYVPDTGATQIDGVKTFTSDPIIPDEAYGSGWNGTLEPPTKNAVYDKIETYREQLTGNRTYYVRTDGSDSNTGLVDSAGGAFLTIQKAVDVACQNIDCRGYKITIRVKDGTYTGAVRVTENPVNAQDDILYIEGNTATPANCIISTTSADCFYCETGVKVDLSGFELRTTTSGNCIQGWINPTIYFSSMRFGTCAGSNLLGNHGVTFHAGGNYSIVGSATYSHLELYLGSRYSGYGITITLSGTPDFPFGFVSAYEASVIVTAGSTYTGAATGKRYDLYTNAVANTSGGGASYFPGDSAGSTATGAQYV